MSKFALLYYWRDGRLDDDWWRVESFSDSAHEKNQTIVGGERPTDSTPFSWTTLDTEGRLVVGMQTAHLPDTPDLWWVIVPEPHRVVPTQSLIGFADGRYPDGTVLTVHQVRADTLSSGNVLPPQAGAVRWGTGDPKLEQLYVAPEFRRRRVSVKMIHAADIVNEAGGWGGHLYGGAELTADGEKLAEAWSGSKRLRQQSVKMPPMG